MVTDRHDVTSQSAAVRDLIARLAAVLEERMTKAGHPAALVLQEHRGICPPRECSARCVEYRALLIEAAEYLEATALQKGQQTALF